MIERRSQSTREVREHRRNLVAQQNGSLSAPFRTNRIAPRKRRIEAARRVRTGTIDTTLCLLAKVEIHFVARGLFMMLYRAVIALFAGGSFVFAQVAERKEDKANAATFSVEQAISLRPITDLQFSPDGRRLAFTVFRASKDLHREQEIWMLNVQSKKTWRFAHSRKSSRNPAWSPDGSQLAFVSDREERAQVYVMPADGGEAESVTSGKNAVESLAWSPKGESIAFLAMEPKTDAEEKKEKDKDDARDVDKDDKPVRLWVIDLAGKKVRQLSSGKWSIAELKWAPKGDRLFVIAAEHPEPLAWRKRVLSVSLSDGATKEIAAPQGPVSDLQVSPDGKHLSFRGARGDGPSLHDLFVIASEGGVPRNLTAKQLDRPVEGYAWQRPDLVLAVVEHGFASRLVFVTLDGKTEPAGKVEVNPVGRAVKSELGDLAFVGQTATQPHEVWLLPAGGHAERVTKINDDLRKASLVKPEIYRYTSFDKAEIESALYRPNDHAKDARVPLVVLIHGGPTGRWADGFDHLGWTQLLASRGFAVFCPNIRGSTGYGWKFLEQNRADWGGSDFKDVMAGVDDLIARGIADPNRLGIAGWSYGGFMSAWAITQTPRFKAAVVGAGISDLASEFGTEMLRSAQYDHWFFGVPYEKAEGFIKSSPITHLKNAKTPTLILHPENDLIDPIGQAQQLHRGLKHKGVECEFVIYPREGHGPQEEKHLLDIDRRLVRWFETHLK
jgi:dipeptidyl aminopeptidase/acylaminoacyl peptidase